MSNRSPYRHSQQSARMIGSVMASFRCRWPRRHLDVSDIVGVSAVTNNWWNGWGVRKVADGWMYNVAGSDAVQLQLRSGREFRIGIDDQSGPRAAIEAARQSS